METISAVVTSIAVVVGFILGGYLIALLYRARVKRLRTLIDEKIGEHSRAVVALKSLKGRLNKPFEMMDGLGSYDLSKLREIKGNYGDDAWAADVLAEAGRLAREHEARQDELSTIARYPLLCRSHG